MASDEAAARRPRLLAPPPRGPLAPRERPTIAVVIAYYNCAELISEAVASALSQTLPPDEIVICDDGSSDDLARALGDLRQRVLVVRKPNGGPASALNAAIAEAGSEFVAQLDSDDVFLPGRIQAISDAIVARPDVDVVATDALTEPAGRPALRYGLTNPFEVASQRREILRRCFFAWPAIRRSRLRKVGGFDERFFHASDWECFIRLILSGSLVALVDEPLYRWRLTTGSVTASAARTAAEDVALLEHTLATQPLSPEERAVVEEGVAAARQRALLLAAKEALADRSPDVRRRSLDVATGAGFALPTRLKALLAAAWPGLAGRLTMGRFEEGSIERRFGADWAGSRRGGWAEGPTP
ncbi:MAG: glycosyltransferase family 2 protein [Gaiellaceae bacterium]